MKIIDNFIHAVSKSEKSKNYLFKTLKNVLGNHSYILLDFSDPENPQMIDLKHNPIESEKMTKEFYQKENARLEAEIIRLKYGENGQSN